MRKLHLPFFTIVFLVLLRLAIGWHFLYEGYHKVHSFLVGPSTSNKPFSSTGYFREAQGPLGGVFRHLSGDPDEILLERLDVAPMPVDQDPANDRPQKRFPPRLAADWQAWLDRVVAFYHLDPQQSAAAHVKMEQAMADFVRWFTTDVKSITRTYPSGTVDIAETNWARVLEYRNKVREVSDVYSRELPAFGRDVEKARLIQTKQELAKLRVALEADLEEQTAKMRSAVLDVLSDAQRKDVLPPAEAADSFADQMDRVTAWFLFGVGASILLGLFTRLGCTLAAGFLLMTYLTAPAFPWLPTPPNQEGNYLFVSKNVVEMFALAALATLPTGRWFGIDGLLVEIGRALFGRRSS